MLDQSLEVKKREMGSVQEQLQALSLADLLSSLSNQVGTMGLSNIYRDKTGFSQANRSCKKKVKRSYILTKQ